MAPHAIVLLLSISRCGRRHSVRGSDSSLHRAPRGPASRRYVRDEKLIPLEQAVYRLTTLPATNLGIENRGALKPGYYADVVVFDPATIADRSTFEAPHQYSVGVRDVFVNGTQVLKDGEHSGATPGRAVRGAGWNRCP